LKGLQNERTIQNNYDTLKLNVNQIFFRSSKFSVHRKIIQAKFTELKEEKYSQFIRTSDSKLTVSVKYNLFTCDSGVQNGFVD
jgi:hypothetical protein